MPSASARASIASGCRSWPTSPAAPAFFPTDVTDLAADYQRILDELRRRYAVGYESTNRARDGKLRKVQIRARVPDVTVRSRGGYFAPAQ